MTVEKPETLNEDFAMRPMKEAPRDGSHFLALERIGVHGTSKTVLEWREVWWKPRRDPIFGGTHTWTAENGEVRFGEQCFVGWIPLPSKHGAFPESDDE